MKKHFDTYQLYRIGKHIKYSARIRVTMKDEVNFTILCDSINKAAKRYPYFCKEIAIDEDGGYDLIQNDRPIVVIKTRDTLPLLGSEEVNRHLIYVDSEGKDINFNICHALAGGRGFTPWVETSVYQYVKDAYHVEVDAPNIIKVDSPLLPNENREITLDDFTKQEPLVLPRTYRGKALLFDYINGLFNPFVRKPQYHIFTFEQKDILKYTQNNDSSVCSAFVVFMFKAMSRVLPASHKIIEAKVGHNPIENFGLKNCHSDILSHVHIVFKREMADWDNETLGTIARSQVYLQTDPCVSCNEVIKRIKAYEKLDEVHGYENKQKYAKKYCTNVMEDGFVSESYIINYTGQRDWGELSKYVESYCFIVEGHVMIEITSFADKIFLSFMQLTRNNKYFNAFKQVLTELQIPFECKGPYKTNHVNIELPKPNKKK